MIVWLPSYPRSGNTLLRMLLKQAFGLPSYSRYNDQEDIGTDPAVVAKVGHQNLPGPWTEALPLLRTASASALIKTHSPPEGDDPAIFVVRHGWAAVLSYQHYLRDFAKTEADRPSIIAGLAGGFPSWGNLLDLWSPLNRPNTLLLRYEDLVASPATAIGQIGDLLRRRPVATWVDNFAVMKQLNPRFFRAGRTTITIDEFGAENAALFAQLHGDWMVRLGYAPAPTSGAANCHFLRRAIEDNPINAESPCPGSDGPLHPYSLRNAAKEWIRLERIVAEQTAYIASLEQELARLRAPTHDRPGT